MEPHAIYIDELERRIAELKMANEEYNKRRCAAISLAEFWRLRYHAVKAERVGSAYDLNSIGAHIKASRR